MTREEAIDCLEGLKIYLKTEHIDQEAVDIAIEALQAEPVVRCIDCIFWYDCEYPFKSENGFCCCGAREQNNEECL